MAIVVYPLDAISSAPTYTGRMLRETIAPMLAGATAGRPLGMRSGVRPGTSVTTVTLASLTYSVAEFAGAMDVQAAAEAGPYLFANNAVATGNLNAQDASNPRADMLCIQVSDNAEDGTAAATGQLVYAAGTAAASPVLPTQPVRSIILATFAVPKVGAGSPTVTWVAPYLSAANAPVLALTKTILDTLTGSFIGELAIVFNDTTAANNTSYRWNGTVWKPAASSVELANASSIANSAVTNLGGAGVAYTETADPFNWHDPVTNPSRVTPGIAGRYLVILRTGWSANSTGVRYGALGFTGVFNATTDRVVQSAAVDGNGTTVVTVEKTLNATDYIEAQVFQSSGGALTVAAVLTIRYLGPS